MRITPTTEELPLTEVENRAAAGRLKDAGTITALFLTRSLLSRTEKSELGVGFYPK